MEKLTNRLGALTKEVVLLESELSTPSQSLLRLTQFDGGYQGFEDRLYEDYGIMSLDGLRYTLATVLFDEKTPISELREEFKLLRGKDDFVRVLFDGSYARLDVNYLIARLEDEIELAKTLIRIEAIKMSSIGGL